MDVGEEQNRTLYTWQDHRYWSFRKSQMYLSFEIVARHDLTNIEVAVKIINIKKMKDKSMMSRVLLSLNRLDERLAYLKI